MSELNYDDILHVLTGNSSGELKKAVLQRVHADPEWMREYIRIKNALSVSSTSHTMPESDVEAMYERLHQGKKVPATRLWPLRRWLPYAAVAAVVLITGLLVQQYLAGRESVTVSEVLTARGQQSRVVLPDKSEVLLNFASRLTYDSRFGSNNRELNLEGQAFFEVTKNKKLPFRVKAGMVQLEVLGTSFDVNSYPDNQGVLVAVYTGTVEMKVSGHPQLAMTLQAGEKANFNSTSLRIEKTRFDTTNKKSWRNGVLHFNGTGMREVLQQLSRKYNIDIVVDDPKVYQSVFTATIRDENFEEVFRLIEYSCRLKCSIEPALAADQPARILVSVH